MNIRAATRGSQLALTQTRWVISKLKAHDPTLEIEEVPISTKGDRVTDRPLAAVGGKGLFVAEVQAALIRGDADFAVHSLKDMPGDVPAPPGLAVVSIPARENPRDVLVTTSGIDLDSLPRGAKVGTTSLRRTVQLLTQRPDLEFATLRGNVDTRLRKLEEGKFDAIVLAAAGLQRLGLLTKVPHHVLGIDTCLPAVGQGALALEARVGDDSLVRLLRTLENAKARVEIEAERALLQELQGNCHSPIAGYARLREEPARLVLDAMVASGDGDRILTATAERYLDSDTTTHIDAARALGLEAARGLIEQGARKLIQEAEVNAIRNQMLGN